MKKYVYQREDLKLLILLGIIVGLPLIILSIIFLLDSAKQVGIIFSCSWIMLYIILFLFSVSRLKWRRWHRKIEQNGYKTNGTVIEFGYSYKSGNIHHDPPTADNEEYWLKVMYSDKTGNKKIFETPCLAFAPEERKDITCDVFIYNDEIVVSNFKNLNKKKTNWGDAIYYIIIGVVIVGISFLISLIKG